ncbi:MAG: sulfatase [Cyclobacteriaceae bacterium]|nr:sulfatase [Cyclobacteriaceae bacterium]
MRYSRVTLIILVVLLFSAAIIRSQQKEIRRPNIILIISDDQSAGHMGYAGDEVVQTPHIDRLANSGVIFTHAFNNAPACAPSRASLLTGRNFWELEEGAVHFSFFPSRFMVFTDLLADRGYAVGYTGKGWGPGNWKEYRDLDPSGSAVQDEFYEKVPQGISKNHYAANFKKFYREKGDKPFFFLLGTAEPHRDLAAGMGKASGLDVHKVKVPGFLPDTEVVREDILDYYYEINWLDKQVGEVIDFLRDQGELKNTVIVITSDNGMPFPRAKSNLYDYGSRIPLLISGPGMADGGLLRHDFVTLKDLAPTFLELAGVEIPMIMNGQSLLPLLTEKVSGRIDSTRDHVVMGKELHAWCHPHGEINPVRGIRTDAFLYILNLKPDLWPAGHPDGRYSWDLMPFGDVDAGPTKTEMLARKDEAIMHSYYELAFGKRPREELYDVVQDPFQLNNLAFKPGYQEIKKSLADKMNTYLIRTGDPRTLGKPEVFDNAPYFWSHGLSTAGLPVDQWNALTKGQQQKKTDSLRKSLGIPAE